MLNTALVLTIVRLAAPEHWPDESRHAVLLALAAGLALSNHHTAVLAAPIGLFALVRSLRASDRPGRAAIASLGAFAVGLLPYAYLLFTTSPCRWNDIASFADLAHHFLRSDYGTTQLATRPEAPEPLGQLRLLGGSFVESGIAPLVRARCGGDRRSGGGRGRGSRFLLLADRPRRPDLRHALQSCRRAGWPRTSWCVFTSCRSPSPRSSARSGSTRSGRVLRASPTRADRRAWRRDRAPARARVFERDCRGGGSIDPRLSAFSATCFTMLPAEQHPRRRRRRHHGGGFEYMQCTLGVRDRTSPWSRTVSSCSRKATPHRMSANDRHGASCTASSRSGRRSRPSFDERCAVLREQLVGDGPAGVPHVLVQRRTSTVTSSRVIRSARSSTCLADPRRSSRGPDDLYAENGHLYECDGSSTNLRPPPTRGPSLRYGDYARPWNVLATAFASTAATRTSSPTRCRAPRGPLNSRRAETAALTALHGRRTKFVRLVSGNTVETCHLEPGHHLTFPGT